MEPVCNLYGIRSTEANSQCIIPGSIPTDELDIWMSSEPAFQAAGRTISKQINDLVVLQIDENRAVQI